MSLTFSKQLNIRRKKSFCRMHSHWCIAERDQQDTVDIQTSNIRWVLFPIVFLEATTGSHEGADLYQLRCKIKCLLIFFKLHLVQHEELNVLLFHQRRFSVIDFRKSITSKNVLLWDLDILFLNNLLIICCRMFVHLFVYFIQSYFVGRDPICPYPSEIITYFPFPGDCTKYIECFQGTRYNMSCPPDLFWNQYASTCDYYCSKYLINYSIYIKTVHDKIEIHTFRPHFYYTVLCVT